MIVAHADWSVSPGKRWMATARPDGEGWRLSVDPVGDLSTLFARLLAQAGGGPVALGLDCPIGLPRAYARLHGAPHDDFPSFLRGLAARPGFFQVADTAGEVSPGRPFFPRHGRSGTRQQSLIDGLGLNGRSELFRACDLATAERRAGGSLFWTVGPNQCGKAAITAWRDLLLPALDGAGEPPLLWPFEGPFRSLLRPGRVAVAECYPADALRQLGLRPVGSKRRQSDRLGLVPGLRAAMAGLGTVPDGALDRLMDQGFGADAAGEDRLDCVLGVLCVLAVLDGRRPDAPPPDPWLCRWEGWVLGQSE